MTTTLGVCTNDIACPAAAARQTIAVCVGEAFVCDVCGSKLQPPPLRRRAMARLVPVFAFSGTMIGVLIGGMAAGMLLERMRASPVLPLVPPPPLLAPANPVVAAPPPPQAAPPQPVPPPAPPVAREAAPRPQGDHAFDPNPMAGGMPIYPAGTVPRGTIGRATVSCLIQADGRPRACRVLSASGRAFAASANAWLHGDRLQFLPVVHHGAAVAARYQWTIVMPPPPDERVPAEPQTMGDNGDRGFSPRAIAGGSPTYPLELASVGENGSVTVRCVIETSGRPTHCALMSVKGAPYFGDSVLRWLNQEDVRFQPILRGGHAVAEARAWTISFTAPPD